MRTGSGRYWRRARALKASSSRDALGMRSASFTDGDFFRCEIRPLSVSEQPYADGVVVKRTFELYARWKTVAALEISEVDRIEIDGRTLRIQSIVNIGNDFREAQIIAEEIN